MSDLHDIRAQIAVLTKQDNMLLEALEKGSEYNKLMADLLATHAALMEALEERVHTLEKVLASKPGLYMTEH